MRINFKIVCCFFLGFLAIACKKVQIMVDDSCTIQKPTDTYVYQKTGAALSPYTPDDQLKECQLPVSVVKNISTEGLVQAWIDFPLVSQILTTNSVQKAVEIFKAKFNGLGELYNRYDGAAKLFDRYKLMKTDCSKTVSSAGKLANEFLYIEILLAQDSLITKMSDVQKKELVRESVSKYRSKLLNTDFGLQVTTGIDGTPDSQTQINATNVGDLVTALKSIGAVNTK